jgi:hypothetical protein
MPTVTTSRPAANARNRTPSRNGDVMVENSSNRSAGKVKWRRFAIAAVPAIAVAGTLVGLTAKGAIASSISVSGTEYTVAASQLDGTGFEQFGSWVPGGSANVPNPAGGGAMGTAVMESAMRNADLYNLCQQVSMGGITLTLKAGSSTDPAVAQNLIVDAASQTGSSAVFSNISIGDDASTLTEDPGVVGAPGSFGQQADSVTINNLVQQTWLTTAGTFTLPDLSLGFGGSC